MIRTLILMLISASLFTLGCKKDSDNTPYKCTSCKTTPDAVAANDASSKGVYKGVVIGSSGTVVFDVLNGGATITATLTIDGIITTLTAMQSWVNGQPYVSAFTGTLNGQPVSITFSVGVSGQTPTVTSANIPGHPNAVFVVVKETSTSLVEAFEGTFTGTQKSGTLNIILSRSSNSWYGAARSQGSTSTNNFSGTISGGTMSGTGMSNSTATGTLGTDVITNGTFTDQGQTGTWSAQRTM